jgi:Dyp-type peroxidase family
LVLLYADDANSLQSFIQACDLDFSLGPVVVQRIGLKQIYRQDASHDRGDLTEPFGFRDGISQPSPIGLIGKSSKHRDLIKTGEFVLGYQDEKGLMSSSASIDNWNDPEGYLADHPDYPNSRRAFGLNGTYLVFRKLSQDVSSFWSYVEGQSGGSSRRRERLAARMVGRWRSGAPLVLSPRKPGAEPVNDFLYTPTDPEGLVCPIGAHIRRANPRDSLPTWPSHSIDTSSRHRIIRRGRKYRIPIDGSGQECQDQGICFIALNADLLRQFEFIQYTWLNNPQFNGLDNDKDPIVGDNDQHYQFTIQATPINCHIQGLPRFVAMRGGGYFFLPGIRALKFLANYAPVGSKRARPSSSRIDAES